jgi:hypothetical protein
MKAKVPMCMCSHAQHDHFEREHGEWERCGMRGCSCKLFTDTRKTHRRAALKSKREAGPKAEIIKLLKDRGIRFFRLNSGSIHIRQGNHVNLNAVGTPDILCLFHYGGKEWVSESAGILWLEVKRAEKGKQSKEQIEFQKQAEALGEAYLICRSAEELAKWLD